MQADQAEGDDVHAERRSVEQRAVAADDARLLQLLDAPQAGRRGNADAAGQLDIGHAAVVLQLPQDFPVDRVQIGLQSQFQCSGAGERILASGSRPTRKQMARIRGSACLSTSLRKICRKAFRGGRRAALQ